MQLRPGQRLAVRRRMTIENQTPLDLGVPQLIGAAEPSSNDRDAGLAIARSFEPPVADPGRLRSAALYLQ